MPDWVFRSVLVLITVGVGVIALRMVIVRIRRWLLVRRFGDTPLVEVILVGQIAQGMRAEMVIASWGKPADMDETVMKTKTRSEMKYDQKGKNRFGTRVYLENGVVVGWETK